MKRPQLKPQMLAAGRSAPPNTRWQRKHACATIRGCKVLWRYTRATVFAPSLSRRYGLWLGVWRDNEIMEEFGMAAFVTYKRWRLKDGKQEADLVDLVRNEIAPHYAKLGGCVWLGLHRIRDTPSYLALQQWQSRAAWETTTASDFYQSWLGEYEPILARWDELMEFEDEWEAEVILG